MRASLNRPEPAGLRPAHSQALQALHSRFQATPGLVWALTGSCSFALQGMDLPVNDIDVITDEAGAYLMGDLLADCVLQPVAPSIGAYIRSHFGRFVVEGIEVEVMGASRRQNMDGSWREPAHLPDLIEYIHHQGLRLPVLSLAFEEQAYRLLRRPERADQIAAFLRERQQKTSE